MIAVTEVGQVTPEVADGFARLIPQLSSSAPAPAVGDLERMVRSDATVLLVARLDGEIVGALTLVLLRTPTGRRARIEDVVVDAGARGRGVGAALSNAAIARAAEEGARTVDLTSRPSRTAANRLYQRLGFVERDTRVYRYQLDR